ncbi:MAG TPA: dockerin type I domain-containing protein, partial [Anaerolineae bacterium]|nr:dockerin type I domain-containing protein [Anaerolineae bacterium]
VLPIVLLVALLTVSVAALLVAPALARSGRAASIAFFCPDYDGSGVVDAADVSLIAAHWATASDDQRFDLDRDGWVTVIDVMQVAGRWQEACPPGSACPFFPADNIWNTRVDTLPLAPRSSAYVAAIGVNRGLHPDFGAGLWDGGPIGIPFVAVPTDQPLAQIVFDYEDESDPGPYPIPTDAPIEGGPDSDGDRHILVLRNGDCRLFETWYTWPTPDGSWQAGSGAVFDLTSHALRPAGWTSSDAAGLPILPGLVRYEEVASGYIDHALRFTAPQTQRAYVWPARHYASSNTDPNLPPMGQRFRLRADFDISGFSAANQVILTALKQYGMILADNGSAWYLSGIPDERWDNDDLHALRNGVRGADFQAVDVSMLMLHPDSGQAATPAP